jgi:hypothetical protein
MGQGLGVCPLLFGPLPGRAQGQMTGFRPYQENRVGFSNFPEHRFWSGDLTKPVADRKLSF